jgi:hypothetical protein
MFKYVIIALVIIIFILAIYWEHIEYYRLSIRPHLSKVPKGKRLNELRFYATFNSDNNVIWRRFFITAVLCVIAITFIINTYHPNVSLSWQANMAILFFIFLLFYATENYRVFHLYRVMSSKVKRDTVIL